MTAAGLFGSSQAGPGGLFGSSQAGPPPDQSAAAQSLFCSFLVLSLLGSIVAVAGAAPPDPAVHWPGHRWIHFMKRLHVVFSQGSFMIFLCSFFFSLFALHRLLVGGFDTRASSCAELLVRELEFEYVAVCSYFFAGAMLIMAPVAVRSFCMVQQGLRSDMLAASVRGFVHTALPALVRRVRASLPRARRPRHLAAPPPPRPAARPLVCPSRPQSGPARSPQVCCLIVGAVLLVLSFFNEHLAAFPWDSCAPAARRARSGLGLTPLPQPPTPPPPPTPKRRSYDQILFRFHELSLSRCFTASGRPNIVTLLAWTLQGVSALLSIISLVETFPHNYYREIERQSAELERQTADAYGDGAAGDAEDKTESERSHDDGVGRPQALLVSGHLDRVLESPERQTYQPAQPDLASGSGSVGIGGQSYSEDHPVIHASSLGETGGGLGGAGGGTPHGRLQPRRLGGDELELGRTRSAPAEAGGSGRDPFSARRVLRRTPSGDGVSSADGSIGEVSRGDSMGRSEPHGSPELGQPADAARSAGGGLRMAEHTPLNKLRGGQPLTGSRARDAGPQSLRPGPHGESPMDRPWSCALHSGGTAAGRGGGASGGAPVSARPAGAGHKRGGSGGGTHLISRISSYASSIVSLDSVNAVD